MTAPAFFRPLSVGGLTLANRIVIASACQHFGQHGSDNDWNLI